MQDTKRICLWGMCWAEIRINVTYPHEGHGNEQKARKKITHSKTRIWGLIQKFISLPAFTPFDRPFPVVVAYVEKVLGYLVHRQNMHT